jgi:hypothetical protein
MADLTWLVKRNSGEVDPATGNPAHPFYGKGKAPVLPEYYLDAPAFEGYFENDPRIHPDRYNIDFTKGPIYQIIPTNKTGTNWFGEMFQPALQHNHTISVDGGNEKNTYLLSRGYLNQQGTLLNTYLKRYTARVNTSFTINDKIRIGENLQLSYRNNPTISLQQALFNIDWNNDIFHTPTANPAFQCTILKAAGLFGFREILPIIRWHSAPTQKTMQPICGKLLAMCMQKLIS